MKWMWCLLIFLIPQSAKSQSIIIWTPFTTHCIGDTIVFYASGAGVVTPHYQWQVNGIATGGDSSMFITGTLHNDDTVQCILTNASGSSLAMSGKIIEHIIPLPNAGIITGLDKVCVGSTITMSDTVADGKWFARSYNLDIDSTGIVGGRNLLYYNCDTLYPDTVFYIVSNTCGTDTAFKLITVNPLPNAYFWIDEITGGYGALCAGSMWYGLGSYCCDSIHSAFGHIAISGHSISKGAPGGDSLYCITTNYCGTASYGTWIEFGGPPEKIHILADFDELCMGMTDTLRSTAKYLTTWKSLNHKLSFPTVYSIASPVVTTIDTGMDIVYVEMRDVCGIASDSYTITVKARPGAITIAPEQCKGWSSVLTDSVGYGTWSSSSNIASIDKFMVTYNDTGKVTIWYALMNGCATSTQVVVEDCTTAIELFPNPLRDELMIHLPHDGYNYCIVSNSIRQIMGTMPINHEYTSINTSAWPAGLYYIKLTGTGTSYVTKIVKE